VADIGGTIGPRRLPPKTVEALAPLLEGQIEARTAILNRPGGCLCCSGRPPGLLQAEGHAGAVARLPFL
jgi:hypothetical protein